MAHTTPSLQTVYLQSTSSHKTSKANQSRLEQVHNPKTLECTTTLEELIVNTSDYTDTPIARFLSDSLRVLRLANRSSDTYRTTRMQLLLHTRSSKKKQPPEQPDPNLLLHDHLEDHKLQIEDTFQSQHAAIDFVQHEVYLLQREMRNQHLQVQAVDLCVVVEYLRLVVVHLDLAAQPTPPLPSTSC